MEKCKTCKHALYDEVWGEYKCRLSRYVRYPKDAMQKCDDYEKGTPETSKRSYDKYDKDTGLSKLRS